MQDERSQLSAELESGKRQVIILNADLRKSQQVNKELQGSALLQQQTMAEMRTSQSNLEQALQSAQVSCCLKLSSCALTHIPLDCCSFL